MSEEKKYDFYIDENNKFIYFPEFNKKYLYSPRESEVPDMPEATETTVKIAGKDGDVVLNTIYEPMNFILMFYTDENLSQIEKTAEINFIKKFLNSIKNKTKYLAFLDSGKMYPVKYSGSLTTVKFPKSVQFSMPLKSSHSYGYDLNSKIIYGSGIEISNTIEETGCIITINGPANNPILALNNYQMKYNNIVLADNKLVIDTNNSTITHITSKGVKTNAAVYYNHEYPKIKNGENEIKIQAGIDNPSQVTTEWYDLKI